MKKLTHHHINSSFDYVDNVRRRERIDPFLGLRQCELEIGQLQKFIRERHSLWGRALAMLFGEDPICQEAEVSLAALKKEYDRILAKIEDADPDFQRLSHEERQQRYAPRLAFNKKAFQLATKTFAARHGIDPGVAAFILEAPSEERQQLLRRANEILAEPSDDTILCQSEAVLGTLPAEIRDRAIIEAAEMVMSRAQVEGGQHDSIR